MITRFWKPHQRIEYIQGRWKHWEQVFHWEYFCLSMLSISMCSIFQKIFRSRIRDGIFSIYIFRIALFLQVRLYGLWFIDDWSLRTAVSRPDFGLNNLIFWLNRDRFSEVIVPPQICSVLFQRRAIFFELRVKRNADYSIWVPRRRAARKSWVAGGEVVVGAGSCVEALFCGSCVT